MNKKINVFGDGSWIYNSKSTDFKKSDVVVMPGGGDWNPALYGHKPNGTSYFSDSTDKRQMDLINRSIDAGKLVFGICRGLN